jgi:hypothetical protein
MALVFEISRQTAKACSREVRRNSSGEFGERNVEEVCDLIVNRQKLLRLPG